MQKSNSTCLTSGFFCSILCLENHPSCRYVAVVSHFVPSPRCVGSVVWTRYHLLIHSLVDRHSRCLQVGATMVILMLVFWRDEYSLSRVYTRRFLGSVHLSFSSFRKRGCTVSQSSPAALCSSYQPRRVQVSPHSDTSCRQFLYV